MVEEIKVVGVWLSLCVPDNGDFIEFESPKSAFNPTRLKKVLLLDCGGGISFLIKYSIIKF
nr:hypothetical protein [Helicobacter pylori]